MNLEGDPCVKRWRSRLGVSFRSAFSVFESFYNEVLNREFEGFSPSDLVEYQLKAVGRDRFRILSLAQSWVDKQQLRHSSKVSYLSWIKSFWMHSQVGLPEDRSFHFKSNVPPVEGKLDFEAFRSILLNCNKLYRAVFLLQAQTLSGEGEVVYISNNYCNEVLQALTRNVGIFKLVLPGRKKNRNIKNFYTLLSTKSDWADAMRDYMKSRSHRIEGCLFRNKEGNPLNVWDIRHYFLRRAVEAGVISLITPLCTKCNGETVKKKKKYSKGLWRIAYICKECGNVDWACNRGVELRSNRYGANPHEIRDLMSSRWRESGAKIVIRKFLMGHLKQVDPNEYDKLKYTPQDAIIEYRKFLPYANIVSCDPSKVDRTEIDERDKRRDAEVEAMSQRLRRLEKVIEEMLEERV